MYYVYILKSLKDGSFYKGRTTNIERRLNEHEKGKTQSNKSKRPFRLIHVEIEDNLKSAIKLELYFKSGSGRETIKELFN